MAEALRRTIGTARGYVRARLFPAKGGFSILSPETVRQINLELDVFRPNIRNHEHY